MALQVSLTLINGISIPQAYIQVDRFVRTREAAEIHFNVYANEAARISNAPTVYYPPVRLTEPAAIIELEESILNAHSNGTRDMERCYIYLKQKVADFAQATDI